MNKNVLLAGDVDAIKEFVFETSFLPQIRGGSQLLIDCEKEIKEYVRGIKGGKTIYCEGGSFLVEMPFGEIEKAKCDIENIYLRKTHTVTVTQASEQEIFPHEKAALLNLEGSKQLDRFASRIFVAATQQEFKKDSYGLRTLFLSGKVRERKLTKRNAPFWEALPFGDRCDCCGKRMASGVVPLKRSGEAEPREILKVCKVCQNKHDKGRSGEEGTRGKFNEAFSRFLECQDLKIRSKQPRDLDDLVKTAKRNYLAFIYADGNNIGDLLSHANSEEDYRAISNGLSEGTESSLFNALYSVCGPAIRKDGYWPFEIINVGGDDVTLLIQAGYAWEVAIQFLENFRKKVPACIKGKLSVNPMDWQITASCGISIADKNYPIRFLQRLSESSLKRAKRKAKEDKDNIISAIDFLWLPNPIISENIESLSGHYHRRDRSLTARPYTLDDAISLHEIVKDALIQIPSTQRHIWGEALDRGINASQNVIFYNIARQSDENKRMSQELLLSKITSLITSRGNEQSKDSLWTFRKEGNKFYYCTALLDVMELTELISMRKDHGKEEPIL